MQRWVLLTNYHRYVDQFTQLAVGHLLKDGAFDKLVMPGDTDRLSVMNSVAEPESCRVTAPRGNRLCAMLPQSSAGDRLDSGSCFVSSQRRS